MNGKGGTPPLQVFNKRSFRLPKKKRHCHYPFSLFSAMRGCIAPVLATIALSQALST